LSDAVMAVSLLEALRSARHVAVLTGAGVSAESGVPTFRDKQAGLWENYEAAELATPEAFARDPSLVWGWYEWRRAAVLRAQPNPAHRAIATLAAMVPELTLITQNVDDLHERAGSAAVLHLHGQLSRPYCQRCRERFTFSESIPAVPEDGQRMDPPRCECGGRIRPGVVWFGESLPHVEWQAAVAAAERCDVFLSVGTSSVVQPAASLLDRARRAAAVTVQVNPNVTGMDGAIDHDLKGPAGVVLPRLVAAI
jgi:NAD-dependent deacetylase